MTLQPDPDVDVLDLDAERAERQQARAAKRGVRGSKLLLRNRGEDIALIEAEFGLDVLEPFTSLAQDVDLALLVRKGIDLAQAQGSEQQIDTLDMIVSVLAANPDLPSELIAAVKESARRLLTPAGYDRLMAQRPTPWDIAALARHLLRWWGVNLGDFSSSSTPTTGGGTSNPTSPTTIPASTRTEPGSAPEPPVSLASAGSPG